MSRYRDPQQSRYCDPQLLWVQITHICLIKDQTFAIHVDLTQFPLLTTVINPSPAELFRTIFHSFKAGIANAISSFK